MDNRSYYHHEDQITSDYSVSIANGVFHRNPTDERNANLLYNILIPLFGAIITISNLAVVISSALSIKNIFSAINEVVFTAFVVGRKHSDFRKKLLRPLQKQNTIQGKKPQLIYLLLGNIALGDLLTGIAVIFGQVFPVYLRNQQICAAQIGLVLSSTVVTINTVGLIGIDRFLFIFNGYHRRQWLYFKIMQFSILVVWICSLLVGFLPLMGWSRNAKNQQACCFVVIVPENFLLFVAVLYTLPISIILLLYSVVIYQAIKKVSFQTLLVGKTLSESIHKQKFQIEKKKSMLNSTNTRHSKNFLSGIFQKEFSKAVNVSKRWKAVKVVGFSTANFLFTWFPYIIVSLYYMSVCDDDSTKRCKSLSLVLASPLAMLGFVNSLVSPIIYAWWHKGFNRYIKRRISTFRLRNPSHIKKVVPNACSNATMTTILENSNERITSV